MKKSSIIKIIIMVIIPLVTVMTVIDLVRGFREPVVFMDGDELVIQCSYGVTIPKRDINSVRLIREVPALIRGDGFGFRDTQKGQVKVSNPGGGNILTYGGLAYVKIPNPPYIYLELINRKDNYVFLNLYDANGTQELYGRIKAWFEGNQKLPETQD